MFGRGRTICEMYPRYTLARSYHHANLKLARGCVLPATPGTASSHKMCGVGFFVWNASIPVDLVV